MVGDWLRITGTVVAKDTDESGRPTVTIEQRATNQHRDLSATGLGVIRLPRRAG
jgi:hypothetical protein